MMGAVTLLKNIGNSLPEYTVQYSRISAPSSTSLRELPWYPIALKYIPTPSGQCTCRDVIQEWFMPHYLTSEPDWHSSCSPALSPGEW